MVALLALVAFAAGCGSAREHGPPLAKQNSTEAGGWPLLGSAPSGLAVRFIERGRFGVGLVLRNRSDRKLTVVDARTLDPLGTLVHNVGTRLVPWNPPPCPGSVRHSCPVQAFLRHSFGGGRPDPVKAEPGKSVGVQLNFRLGSCGEVPFASPAAARQLEVDYRYGEGRLRRETLPLGAARPRLRMPKPSDCIPRPHSHIAVGGQFSTSSDWTIPGSDGDTCSRTPAGGLRFKSRLYQRGSRPAVWVSIRLPRLRGPGLYRTLPHPARALGPAQVLVVAGIGIHGWTAFRASASVVTVTRAAGTTPQGRFRATLTGRHGVSFRAYGAWRCTTATAG